ncbi:MAG: LLM class flavin-dependent oxidoreductase [Calditrichaeota bacterium]|nr:LLM class flavin-dependent oxidoreductase [Calditrichota bacterium]MBT7616699.1 LLM class flavin-dependent oxidoreductase [Calditrichota bacterium]MBT7787811.1 LLM class flavin-dependent oxidoreductase [Calditrichota bacterium]
MKISIFSVSDYYPDLQVDRATFIDEQVELAQISEDLGYYAYFNAEHHFHEYGLIPDPALLLAAVAMKTKTIKLAAAVSLLTFLHPLRAAEQWAMVDNLSKGRLILGVGSGYLMHEFEGFNISIAQKRDRFDEILEIMEKALSRERFSYKGKFHEFKNVQLNIGPYQDRKIDTAIAILTETAAYYIGKRGYQIMTIPYATVEDITELKPIYDSYHRGLKDSNNGGSGEIMAGIHTYVSEEPASRNSVAREHIERYVNSRLYAKRSSYDKCLDRRIIACGNPDEVTASLQRLIDQGTDHIMTIQNFGGMPLDKTQRSMELLKKEVIPRLKGYNGDIPTENS